MAGKKVKEIPTGGMVQSDMFEPRKDVPFFPAVVPDIGTGIEIKPKPSRRKATHREHLIMQQDKGNMRQALIVLLDDNNENDK